MNVIGQLLLTISLAVAALAAATSYHVSTARPAAELINLELAAGAGAMADKPSKPLLPAGTVLTADDVALLRGEARYVRVRQFAFNRWPGRWWFLGSLVLMVAGAAISRKAAGRGGNAGDTATAHEAGRPEAMLDELAKAVSELRDTLAALPAEQQMPRIAEVIGHLQSGPMSTFGQQHDLLAQRLGRGAAAEVFDRYAAAERKLNRAWCAASDDAAEEARSCLDEAAELIAETASHLAATTAS